jgi:hypothetical protein
VPRDERPSTPPPAPKEADSHVDPRPEESSAEPSGTTEYLGDSGDSASPARMALFFLPDGMTLEIHIPQATAVRGGPSPARQAGFILRRGREIINVGPLARTIWR